MADKKQNFLYEIADELNGEVNDLYDYEERLGLLADYMSTQDHTHSDLAARLHDQMLKTVRTVSVIADAIEERGFSLEREEE